MGTRSLRYYLGFGKGIERHGGGKHVEKCEEQDDDESIRGENEIVLGQVVGEVGHCGASAS